MLQISFWGHNHEFQMEKSENRMHVCMHACDNMDISSYQNQ